MVRQSFTKYEHEVLPAFRMRMSQAESTEDVKKFFVHSAEELLQKVFHDEIDLRYGDVALDPDETPYYSLSERIQQGHDFPEVWGNSDLPNLFGRMAETAMHRYWHLQKHPAKTESKLRPPKGPRRY